MYFIALILAYMERERERERERSSCVEGFLWWRKVEPSLLKHENIPPQTTMT